MEDDIYQVLSYKSVAQRANNLAFTDYYYWLMLITRSLFEWKNLPNNMNERWIERYLYRDGRCVFYDDPELGLMVAGFAETYTLNCYNDPTSVTPIAPNYTYKGKQLINGENAIVIRNNDMMIPSFPMIRLYAKKLANLDRSIEVNVEAQKTPVVVQCSDKQRLSLKNAINQRIDNEPVMFVDKSLDLNDIKILDLNPPLVFPQLQLQKHNVLNECFTRLGINNANMDKRERLVADEVQANNEQVQASEDVMLKARQKACEEINNLFGTNISVERRKLDKIPEFDEFIDVNRKEEQ